VLSDGLKRFAMSLGLHVGSARSSRPVLPAEHQCISPLDAVFVTGGRPFLIDVALSDCRCFGFTAFPPTPEGLNPFSLAVAELQVGPVARPDSALVKFYKTYQPKSAAELLGIDRPDSHPLSMFGPAGAPWPWRPEMPGSLEAQRPGQVAADARKAGISDREGTLGDPFFGPVSDARAAAEIKRLEHLAVVLRGEGYRVDPVGLDNITGVVLQLGTEWRVLVTDGGQHRLCVLGAMGIQAVTVQIRANAGTGGIVRGEDVEHWPMVRAGILKSTEAFGIFERLFRGIPPAAASEWVDVASSRLASLRARS
jgi:hypothetical protein